MKSEKNFTIYKSEENITIGSNRFNEYLSIDLSSFKLKHFTEIGAFGPKIMDCYGIIGIITLTNNTYLITITEAKCITLFCKREIYKIVNTEFIPFYEINNNKIELLTDLLTLKPSKSDEKTEDENIIDELKIIFKTGFYFSNKFDLANSIASQNQIINDKKLNQSGTDYDYIVDGNRNFLANYKLVKKLILYNKKNSTRVFLSNCIYGNIEQFKYDNNEDSIQIIIISRRNIINYGLSYFKKGLTKEGYNSNLIETEIILIQNNSQIYSNVYLSSYLPLFYKKNHDEKMNEYFDKYFKALIFEYNLLIMLILKEGNYEHYIDKFKELLNNNKLAYEKMWKFFTVDNNEKSIQNLLSNNIKKGSNLIEIMGFTHIDNHLKYIKDEIQIGSFILFGINDNIMTKNQIYLAYKIIYEMYNHLEKKDQNFINLLKQDINLETLSINTNYSNQLIRENSISSFKFLENIKIAYQKRFIELSKQYNYDYDIEKNIEKVETRQRLLDLIFSKEKRIMNKKEEINSLREEFSTFSNIKIFVGTWNTGCTNINIYDELSLDLWLMPKNDKIIPNIYFIGLQEVVELNTANIVSNKEDKQKVLKDWGNRIEKTLIKIGKYKKLIEMNLVGINFYFYILESEADNITNLTNKFVKTGLGGTAGNKGSCCINFNYYTTSISVACSHLAAGKKNNKQRLKELTHILNLKTNEFKSPNENNVLDAPEDDSIDSLDELEELNSGGISTSPTAPKKNKQLKSSNTFADSDIWIIFGDLNFRIDMEYEEFSDFVKDAENWSKLLEYDQFNKNKLASLKLMEIVEEDPIAHQPTYKYIVGTDLYDYTHKKKNIEDDENKNEESLNKSGKKRNPSWCDRIFYKKNTYERKHYGKIIKGTEYNNVMDSNFQTSDHRPIYNIFDVIVFEEDKAKRNRIEKEVESNEKLGINSKYFKTPKYNL